MAGKTDFQNGAPFYLDSTQQDLLLAALASNNQNPNNMFNAGVNNRSSGTNAQFQYSADGVDPTFFTSPQQSTPATGFGTAGIDESPFIDYLDGDNSFDFDNADDDLMIGALPGDSPSGKNGEDSNDKRKSPDDDDDEDEGGGKRREGEDKQAKKPGRKPLTSEPTTKRKAQNRAAQRAFRERKEKHLKDLETKVQELEKASDAANHENGLLRGQVQRLQMELREYRKRLSLNSTGLNRTPPLASGFSSMLNTGNNNNNFSFEFPRFGGLPGTQLLDNGPLSKAKNASMSSAASGRQNSNGPAISPAARLNGSFANSPDSMGASPVTNGAQRNNILSGFSGFNTAPNKGSRGSTDSSATSQSRVFQFNSGSSTHSGSPSSSTSPSGNQDSSCGTSPEPSHMSPGQLRDTIADGYVCHGNSEGEVLFCEKLNMACGNPRNPVPRAMSKSDDKPSPVVTNVVKSPTPILNGIDYFANENGGQFDPTLFGEYRDTQAAIVGDGDFTGGFFNDAFLNAGYGSPFHFGDTPAIQKPNPLEEIERLQEGEDEVVPGDDINSMLNCHKIWSVYTFHYVSTCTLIPGRDKLSSRPDFKDGTIDIDNLCSELRAKARCSESGVVVDHKDVEAALKRLPKDAIPL
ncbi:PAP1-domain-containing protein [Ophiobolus disseminans]|uniref:PAP1-domain-containing protein n=1 Tax=Ophiobolus disseminans TaxID=1469910 RepID=A0A6A7ABP8_9PLEO|nr:PAP1-domain-containing protein [Ophiobolus disseminans]